MTDISPTGANETGASNPSRQTIAVIGGGPGAMFFCHALELQKKELLEKGEDVSGFPIVRCFERSAGPGGVWRSDRSHEEEGSGTPRSQSPATVPAIEEEKKDDDENDESKTKAEVSDHDKTNMYSALWTNGPKEQFEMSDYTFKDHFGNVEMPTFLPRKYVLEYLLARVTRNCPDFFEKYFTFRTSVENVQYLGDENASSGTEGGEANTTVKNKFRICTLDETTGVERVEFFDKCIWAAGENGHPSMPSKTIKKFTKGGFTGRMFHSSDTSTFKADVEGKNVLLIGGGFSAEDLALMAVKEGASNVYVACRFSDGEVVWNTRWPYDRVKVFEERQVTAVSEKEVTLSEVYWSTEKGKYVVDKEIEKIVVSDIDTVIFCTGYKRNVQMLDQQLQDPLPSYEDYYVPSDWTMKDNDFSLKILGESYKTLMPNDMEVEASEDYPHSTNLYRGTFCIDNPNMMYIQEYGDGPLLSIDIFAWCLAKVVTNQVALPSPEVMRAEEYQILLDHLSMPTVRYMMDFIYQDAVDEAVENDESLKEVLEEEWEVAKENLEHLQYDILGEIMNRFEYPVSYLCPDGKTYSKYSEAIKAVWEVGSRECLHEVKYDLEKEEDGWRTFRDYPDNDKCTSYFTGLKSKSLPKPWIECDENEKLW